MKNYTATYATGRNNTFVAQSSFDALNAINALAKGRKSAPEGAHLLEVVPTDSLSENVNLCVHCYAAAGSPAIVEVVEGMAAICHRCDEEDNELDLDIVAVKRVNA